MKRLFAVVVAFAAFGASRPAAAVSCSPMGPPTNFAVTMVVVDDTDQYVHLTWTRPASVTATTFERYVIERRDDTAGTDFESVYDLLTNDFGQSFNNYVDTPPTGPPGGFCTGVCAKPGHSYTYRLATQFHYAFGCDQWVNGKSERSVSSNEAAVTVPGVDPTAPQDLVAVAETKKPKVHLSWKAAPTKPTQYVIERRTTTEKAGPKDGVLDFLEIGRVDGAVLAYVDKTAVENEDYEYAVAVAVAGGIGGRSKSDEAYTVGKCPAPRYDAWTGPWAGFDDDVATIDFQLGTVTPGAGTYHTTSLSTLRASFSPALSALGRTKWKAPLVTSATDTPPGEKGAISVAFDPLGPFDFGAFRSFSGVVKLKSRTDKFTAHIKSEQPTTLCATVGAAKPSGKPGSVVVVVFECEASPTPLYSGRVALDVNVENGELVSKTPNSFLQLDPDYALADARYKLGALGPDKKGKAQIARLAVAIRLGDPAVSRQTRCRFTFVNVTNIGAVTTDLGGGGSIQSQTFAQPERVVEIQILPPS